jgi:hypothetical protein
MWRTAANERACGGLQTRVRVGGLVATFRDRDLVPGHVVYRWHDGVGEPVLSGRHVIWRIWAEILVAKSILAVLGRSCGVAVLCGTWLTVLAVGQDPDVWIEQPTHPGSVELNLTHLPAGQQEPFGYEAVAADSFLGEDVSPASDGVGRSSQRATLRPAGSRQLLALYAHADARYELRDVSGVSVMRPVVAWQDSLNPLNRRLPGRFTAADSWQAVVKSLCEAAGTRTGGMRVGPLGDDDLSLDPPTRQARRDALDRPVEFELARPTVLDTLNRLVQTHGQLGWVVIYPNGRPFLQVWTFYRDAYGCEYSPSSRAH